MTKENIKILIDSSSGLSQEECQENGYEIIGLPFMLDDEEYNDLTIDWDDFYKKLESASKINTSQANIEVVSDKIDEMLKTCDKVLYLPITSGLSSSYNAGYLLSEEEYKGKVYCIDHRTISVPEVRLLSDVKAMIDKGLSASEIKEKVESKVKNDIWIVVDNFNYLKKGGRVDAVTATLGNILSIKPILYSDGGKFTAIKKERSIKNAFDSMLDFEMEVLNNDLSKLGKEYMVDVAYTKNIDLANEMKQKIHERFGVPLDSINMYELPKVVGCHTGPNTIGTALYRKII